jgi:peptide/nickel transport system permease protein
MSVEPSGVGLAGGAFRVRRRGARQWLKWWFPGLSVIFLLVGLSGQWLAPRDANDIDLVARFQPPFESLSRPFGTDQLGRDILSRTLVGASLSLSLAASVIVLSGSIGISIGMIAGFVGERTDAILMRIVDAMLAIPAIMLALLLVAVIGAGFWSVVVALMLVTWARYARFVRAEVMALRSREYIDAAVVCGTPLLRILWRHFLPNILNSIVVLLTLDIGRIILLESSLAFLGLGLPPDRGAWGSTIAEGKAYLQAAPWIALTPALAMMVTIVLANGFGNWLSDWLDPRLRRSAL